MRNGIAQYLPLSDEAYQHLKAAGQWRTYAKNELLLPLHKPVSKMFFIEQGLLRGYRLVDGLEITHHFYPENWFGTDYQSYLTGTPCELHLTALTEVTVYEFQKSALEALFHQHHELERLGRILAEDAYLQMVERLKEFQIKDLKMRYLNLINKNPGLFQQVPQKHIASYLGVAPQSLSRIKEHLKHG